MIGPTYDSKKVKHLSLVFSGAGSTSIAALGTGLLRMPIRVWATASGVGSVVAYNGTGGSTFFKLKLAAGGYVEVDFHDDTFIGNKTLVLESGDATLGVGEFHVWYVAKRVGAGSDALGL